MRSLIKAKEAVMDIDKSSGYPIFVDNKMPNGLRIRKRKKQQDMEDPIFYAHEMSKGSPKSLFKKSMKELERLCAKGKV